MAKGRKNQFMSSGLGRRVFQARLSLSSQLGYSVTQTAVGRALGTTGTSIGRYEAGLKEPDLEMIERLAMVLRVEPCYLAFGCHHPTTSRDISESEEEHSRFLPAHPPSRRELEDEHGGPPAPPARIQPLRGAIVQTPPVPRTSAVPQNKPTRQKKGPVKKSPRGKSRGR